MISTAAASSLTPTASQPRNVFSAMTGEFAAVADEAAFLHYKQPQTQKLLGFTLLFCASFYLVFALTDLVVLGPGRDFLMLLCARLAVAATAVAYARQAYRGTLSVGATRIAACVAEAIALGCFMLISATRVAEFHWHAMSLAIMLIVIYLYIPNSFTNALVLALSATAGFLALALRLGHMRAEDVVT